jgi:RimJ/RimL family protein N-acetyltransferase
MIEPPPFDAAAALGVAPEPSPSPAPTAPTLCQLPSGRVLPLDRSRWDGPLDAEELAWCRANGIPLAYDCAQTGWVVASCHDDEPMTSPNLATSAGRDPESEALQLRATHRLASSAADDAERNAAVRDFAARHGVRTASALHFVLQFDAARRRAATAAPPTPAPTPAFTFRPWTAADAPAYRALLDNPRLWQFLPEPFPGNLTEAMARTLIEVGSLPGRQETLAVERDGTPVGQVLLRFDPAFAGVRAGEVAYWLGEAHWGKGWMPQVLAAFLERSFAAHQLDVVYAWIHDENRASERVAERCGLRRDTFPLVAELAQSLQRPRFRRFVRCRGEH